jgi:hypothetical protein
MNYKDALNASITEKLTKSQLIELAHALQDRCLLNELDQPPLISPKLYIKDIQSRMDIHHYEMRELNKDIRNVVSYVKQTARTLSNT